MDESTDDARKRLYSEHEKQAWSDRQSSSDEYDKQILALSSAFLGLSVAFVKDIVPLEAAVYVPLLIWAWVLFLIAILSVVISFRFSVWASDQHVKHARRYYIKGDECALTAPNRWSWWTECTNWLAGMSFVVALVLLVVFAAVNVSRRPSMGNHSQKGDGSSKQRVEVPLQEGRTPVPLLPVPSVPQIGEQKGRTPVPMTEVPPAVKPGTTPLASGNESSPTTTDRSK